MLAAMSPALNDPSVTLTRADILSQARGEYAVRYTSCLGGLGEVTAGWLSFLSLQTLSEPHLISDPLI